MRINTLSALPVFLVVLAVTQAAPTPASHKAPEAVSYHGVNPNDPHDTISGYTEPFPEDAPTPEGAASLSCRDRYLDDRDFGITCEGDEWYVWARCSSGKQYKGGPITVPGPYKAVITCPLGTTAEDGGAYGY